MWRPDGLEEILLESFLKPFWKSCVDMMVSTRGVESSTGGLAIAWRNCRISGIGSMLDRSYVPWSTDVELTFQVNGGMIWLRLPETPGVSIAWLKWSMFWLVITEKSSEGLVMDLLAPVGWELLSRMGISTL